MTGVPDEARGVPDEARGEPKTQCSVIYWLLGVGIILYGLNRRVLYCMD